MAKTYYCARCLNSFKQDGPACPNLACGGPRPEQGWGRLLAKGDLLDRRYRVIERLAVGGAGITYRAREVDDDDDEVGPELAVKVLFQRGDGTWLKRLANEARVLQELDHPSIVQSRGFVQRTGHPAYLVTVYEPGGNLFDHVRHHGSLSVAASLGVFEQVLEALAVAHRRGVIHRDLKPQNLFLRAHVDRETAPHILVADFGIAKLQGFLGEHLTTAGMFVGTPEFAAPEQFKGLPPEPPSDVFAAACILWFCLTGGPPVKLRDRTDLVASLRALREGLPPSLPEGLGRPEERTFLEELVGHTLLPDPAARWRIPTLLEALAEFDGPEAVPLDLGPMATLTPDDLQAALTPDDLQSAPTPPPTPLQPEPTPEPPKRVRLDRATEPHRPAPQPARPLAVEEGLDGLFDLAADDGVVHLGAAVEDDSSLEDLFAEPRRQPVVPPPPPVQRPEPSPGVLDASWQTVADETDEADEADELPPPTEPAEPAPAWVPAEPVSAGPAADDAHRLAQLGRCPVAEREALFEALEDPAAAARQTTTSAPFDHLCGTCLAIAHFELDQQASWCRQLLTHATADVRATAALALGAVGATGQLAQLNRLLSDSTPEVRLAAVHALRRLGARTGRDELVQGWLQSVAGDPDPRVREALRRG